MEEPYGSERIATYGDPGRSLCAEISDLKDKVKILTDVIFQLVQKIGDHGTSLNG